MGEGLGGLPRKHGAHVACCEGSCPARRVISEWLPRGVAVAALLAHPPAPALLKPPVSHRPPCVPPCPLRARACRARAAGVKLVDGGGSLVAAKALVGRSVPVTGPHIAVARGAGRSGRGPLCARCHTCVTPGPVPTRGAVGVSLRPRSWSMGRIAEIRGGAASSCRELGVPLYHKEGSG
jgi:hypothetical protein